MSDEGLQIAGRIEGERNILGLSKTDVWKGIASSGMYSQWMNGSVPSATTLVKLAQRLKVNEKWLASGKGAKYPGEKVIEEPSDEFVGIKYVEFKISAGVSGFVVEYLNGERAPIFYRKDWIESKGYHPDYLHAVEVTGSSMEPTLWPGDVVIVNTQDTNRVDGVAYAFNYEGEVLIKRLKREAGLWYMASDNSDKRRYPDKVCEECCFIIGRIVEKRSEQI